jgi:hypothetical protein
LEEKMMLKRLATGMAMSLIVSGVPAVASADVFLSGAGGVFSPYEGQAGFTGSVQVLGGAADQKGMVHLRGGGEIEYRSYKSSVFGVHNVGFESGSVRGIVQYHFLLDAIDPYVGGGFGFDFNVFDADEVERQRPELSVTRFGYGLGLLGLLGVEVPIGSTFALFAEGRASVSFQLTETKESGFDSSGDIGVENLGGVTGIGGIRFRF